jgi:DNA ligase-1
MNEMTNVFKIFNQLQSTSKKTEKIKILKANERNILFTDTLKWLLNPFVITGISTKKLNKPVKYDTTPIQTWRDMMMYLETNNTGRDTDIAIVQGFISLQPEEYKEYYRQLVTKSLKLGIDAKTVNAVYGNGFVPNCEIQLANKYFERPEKVTGEFTLTEKLDGYRTACLVHDDKIELFSRQGQPMEGFVEVEQDMKAFLAMNNIHNAFFDGELVAVNCEDLTSAENYKIVTTIARKKEIKSGLKNMIFDTLRYEDFIEQTCDTEYWKRRKLLERIFDNVKLDHVCLLPVLYQGVDKSMIMKYLNKARDKHKEGIMINLDDKPYEFKRTNNLLKVKVMQDADLKIIDVYEGTGKNANNLGGIIVEFIYNGKRYQCECGSGFSDKERVDFWDNPDKIIGKIATIQFFEISKNDDGGFGLRFPVWIHRIRDDKTEISMN